MGGSFFQLGDYVHLEFISEEDSTVEPSFTADSSSSSSFLAIDLVNFTGRLLVSRSNDVTEASSISLPETDARSESLDTSVLVVPWDERDTSTSTTPPRAHLAAVLSDDTPRHQNTTCDKDEEQDPALLANDSEAPASQEEEEDAALDRWEGDDDDAAPESALVSRQDNFSFGSIVSSIMSSNNGLTETILEDSSMHVESNTDEEGPIEESGLSKPSPRRRRISGISMFHTPIIKNHHPSAKPWGLVFAAAQIRKRMPIHMQERRNKQREAANADPHHTKLHIQCGNPDTTLQQLHDAFMRNPEAVSIQNARGSLPLHILADNEELAQTPHGREIATTFALELMRAHPESVTCKDISGNMPFMGLIRAWLDWAYEVRGGKGSKTRSPNSTFGVGEAVDRLRDRMSIFHSDKDGSRESHELDDVASPLAGGKKSWLPNASSSSQTFPRVSLWHEVEWCFSMLSLVMDELGGKSGGLHKNTRRNLRDPDKQDKICRDLLPTHMAEKFPFLLKTVLLLEEDGGDTRRRLLKMSIFRRILVCPESVGPWLTSMLHKKGIPSIRAVDYLAMLSQTSVEDYVGGFRTIILEDIDDFHEHRCRLFDAVEGLPGTIASLVILDERETERAAATQVAWYIMSKNLLRPFVVGLVLIDFVLVSSSKYPCRNSVR
jgi:1,2-phenylacetyl-CoA epoxidase PaaB subunit